MPIIVLNACKKCGAHAMMRKCPSPSYVGYRVECSRCDNRSSAAYCPQKELIAELWNAQNPQEVPHA